MTNFEEAALLVQHSRSKLGQIEQMYAASLAEKAIKPELLIEIKNFMENLRSALDFTARGLFQKYGYSPKENPKVYFPYALLGESQTEFHNRKTGSIDNRIPGLSKSRPDIVAKIESYQHFADPSNKWLPIFMDLNNENKHQQLTPQARKEFKELRVSSDGAGISLGPGASISLGKGSSIQLGGMVIPGGQTFDADSPPRTIGSGLVTVITWVSFHFSANNEPVLPLLKQSLERIDRIVQELAAL